jgi:hypothetical protein
LIPGASDEGEQDMNPRAQAAMVLCFDIEAAAQAEHDDWHSTEHLPERLAIPGFVRGTRWAAVQGGPGYLVVYEVAQLEVLSSPAYLQRLNHPSAWTTRIMPRYSGMHRGLCRVLHHHGHGLGGWALLLRFAADSDTARALGPWLRGTLQPALQTGAGLVSAAWMEAAAAAELTAEQRLRGRDQAMGAVLLVTGHSRQRLAALATEAAALASGDELRCALYQMAHSLHCEDLPGRLPH